MLKRKMLESLGRFDHFTQWFDLSISDTIIDKKYFSTDPPMFNVPNKALNL